MTNIERFTSYLLDDHAKGRGVKIDLKVAPWELIGYIDEVTDTHFTVDNYGDIYTVLISDIEHYRVT